MSNRGIYNWQRISFFNLFVVSCLGVMLRYKIVYPLPFVDQKFLLESHSHFAFAGWLTQILMVLIVKFIYSQHEHINAKKYNTLFIANLICAYGMLFSFPFEGYAAVSIVFSTASIFVSYAFCFVVWKDLKRMQSKSICIYWFKAAIAFNAISSIGAFTLAFLMANNIHNSNLYLAAIYFFLHFQYNGWFFFAAMGLLQHFLEKKNLISYKKIPKLIFWLFFSASIPAYFLSALWLPIPEWLYIVIVAAAVAQLVGLVLIYKTIFSERIKIATEVSITTKWLWILSLIAFTIKILLQLGSTIPSLNMVAYGFRPIVIGYLHLVFLGVFTIFLLGYFLFTENVLITKWLNRGIIIFVGGIILNEILLMLQGVTSMMYIPVEYINEYLLGAAFVMFSGLLIINRNLKKLETV